MIFSSSISFQEPGASPDRAGKEFWADFGLLLGTSLVIFIGLFLLLIAISQFLNLATGVVQLSAAGLGMLIWIWIYAQRLSSSKAGWIFILACALLVILFAVSVIWAGRYFDTTWDGQVYHQVAVMKLAEGWNPLWDGDQPPISPRFDGYQLNFYPRGVWQLEASIYQLTDQIEQSKGVQLLFIVAAFSLALKLCLGWLPNAWSAVLVSLGVALNPVAITQILSFYVDGILASSLSCFVVLLLLAALAPDRFRLMALAAITAIAVSTKGTAIVYLLVLGGGLLGIVYWAVGRERAVRLATSLLAAGILGVLVFSYNPYITNTLRYSNPFYPVSGPNTVGVMGNQRPANFYTMNRFQRLGASLFSRSANTSRPLGDSEWKIPFTATADEWQIFSIPDVRVGGFGPLFSGGLILAGLALVTLLLWQPRLGVYALLGWILLTASVLIIPEPWWARFVPQTWLVPLVSAGFALRARHKTLNWLGWALVSLLLVNSGLILNGYIRAQSGQTQAVHQELAAIGARTSHLAAYFDTPSTRLRLEEAGISVQSYFEPGELPCNEPENILNAFTWACFPEPAGAGG